MELTFPDEGPIKAKDLSYYLYYFSAVYTVAVEKYGDIPLEQAIGNIEYLTNDFRKALYEAGSKSPFELRNIFFSDLGDKELVFNEISKQSPLSLFGKGVITAIVLSAIISGGTVEGFGVKVEMRPLGEGIILLKKAFKDNPEPELEIHDEPTAGM